MPRGPLAGIRVVELAGIGPGPMAAMVLADFGADVVRVDRIGARVPEGTGDLIYRGRRSIAVDLKAPEGVDTVLRLVDKADVLIEGFRPGVAERLGLGPDICLARNPALVYGRMTGWGQHGPLAHKAGHDIDYIALAGALWPIGPPDGPPTPPLNLVGDLGGGGMLLLVGVLAALVHVRESGAGQVVDAAMVDGASLLMTFMWGLREIGYWQDSRSGNPLDGSAPYYATYTCSDGKYIAVGAMEPQFYAELLRVTGLTTDALFADQLDAARWPAMKARLAEVFAQQPRDEWVRRAEDADACLVPVLDFTEVPAHPHHVARESFVVLDGRVQPAPAPRFSATPARVARGVSTPGADTDDVLADWLDIDAAACAALRARGSIG